MSRHDLTQHTLPSKWWDLTIAASDNEPFDCEKFLETYKETYALCREYMVKNSIDRNMSEIIINASQFVSASLTATDHDQMAACELTNAMLNHCFCEEPKPTLTDRGTWCLCKEEFEIDFSNPEEELEDMFKLLLLLAF